MNLSSSLQHSNMQDRKTIAEWRKRYATALSPTAASEKFARSILEARDGKASQSDNDQIIQKARDFEQGFFRDIVAMAEELSGQPPRSLQAVYINAALNEYNYYAFTATDGYIVLSDDYFTRLFFFLSLVLVLDTQNQFEEEKQNEVKTFVQNFVYTDFLQHRKFEYAQHPLSLKLLNKDPEAVEMANYLFYSLFAFVLCHEISHHILGHTNSTLIKKMAANQNLEIEVDNTNHTDEYEADKYGCNLFLAIMNTIDDRYQQAFFKYRYPYAPVITFLLFQYLDDWSKAAGRKVSYDTHPPPSKRIEALQSMFNLEVDDPLFQDLCVSMEWFLQL